MSNYKYFTTLQGGAQFILKEYEYSSWKLSGMQARDKVRIFFLIVSSKWVSCPSDTIWAQLFLEASKSTAWWLVTSSLTWLQLVLDSHRWVPLPAVGFSAISFNEESQEDVTPPSYLMEHPPLAVFINGKFDPYLLFPYWWLLKCLIKLFLPLNC